MEPVLSRGAGLDVHKKWIVVCVLIRLADGRLQRETRTFGTSTRQILELADWLAQVGVTEVAMESTGVLWKPVYNLLDGRFKLLVCNAAHIRNVPGRKTDVKDAEWIAELLLYGLLRASFVPPRPIRELRDLTRERSALVADRVRVANRIEKVLEDANLKLQAVASNVLGVSGRLILNALLAGERDAARLAALARGKLCAKKAELTEALNGRVTEHHVFMLRQALQQVDSLDAQVEAYSERVAEVQAREDQAQAQQEAGGGTGATGTGPADSAAGQARGQLSYGAAMRALKSIPGVARKVAEVVISEIGLDMSRFGGSADRLASWAGVCPGNNESAGKILSGKTRKGNRYLRSILCEAAWAAWRAKPNFLRSQFTRLARRRGAKRAAMAVGHSILRIMFQILSTGTLYEELGADYHERLDATRLTRYLVRRLEKLGHRVVLATA